jgi:hypothetical protein
MTRFVLVGAGLLTLGATPSLFAGDPGRDYSHLRRENADIREDRWRLHEDLEHGRFLRAERERRDLRRDYAERNALRRDIRRDQRWW